MLFNAKTLKTFDPIRKTIPGLALSTGIACFASILHTLPGFASISSLMLAILLGILIRNTIGIAQSCRTGIQFSLKCLLRVAIALLGLQLSLAQLITVGAKGLGIIFLTLSATFAFTIWMGRKLNVSPKLTQLIAAGTSICGASAVIATNAVVDDSDENTAYAVAMVTIFGTCSMVLYPALSNLLHLAPDAFGIWCGASIHEVAQVIAAAFQGGTSSGQIATVAKLSRVILLAPMMVLLGLFVLHPQNKHRELKHLSLFIPWFVIGFVALIGINSLNIIPDNLKSAVIQANRFLLVTALASMGLETNLKRIQQVGIKPLYLAFLSWLFISSFSLVTVIFFYH